MYTYYVDPWIALNNPRLVTQIGGVPVAVNGGSFEHEYAETKETPARKVMVKEATQEQLKQLFDEGSPIIKRKESPLQSKAPAADPVPAKP